MEGYCFHCKARREMMDAIETTKHMKNGRTILYARGTCEKCGTKMCRILKNFKE